jgi:hypothetical protein
MDIRQALEWVRNGLRSGLFAKIGADNYPEGKNGFNMGRAHTSYSCGSVACIGGWAWVAQNLDKVERDGDFFIVPEEHADAADNFVYRTKDYNKELGALFFPPGFSGAQYRAITMEQAAQAIDNYLETGDPKWDEVVEVAEAI